MRKYICVLILLCGIWISMRGQSALAFGQTKPVFQYDRLEVLERFLKTVYPELVDKLGMVEVVATFEGKRGTVIQNFKFYPCSSDGNANPVTIGSVNPMAPQPNTPPPTPVPPRCGTDPTGEFEHYLDVYLGLTPGHQSHPIFKFAASGTYVDAKLKEVRDQFAGKPTPTDEEAIQLLLSRNPRFGPKNKKEFLATISLEKIREITGCRLRPETTTFVVEMEEVPQHLPPDLQWHILGSAPATKDLTATDCSATFEPFEGRLTLFMD